MDELAKDKGGGRCRRRGRTSAAVRHVDGGGPPLNLVIFAQPSKKVKTASQHRSKLARRYRLKSLDIILMWSPNF